jgi:hypothetical protein
MEGSDPCHPVSPDSCARPAIPPLRHASLHHGPTRPRRPGVFGFGNSFSRSQGRGRAAGLSGCWGTLLSVRHVLGPRQDPKARLVAASGHGPSGRSPGGLPARSLISGLDSTAFALAVYASSAGSPQPTPDSLPAACQALPGGIGYPQGSSERFPLRFLLSQPIRTQERDSSPTPAAGEPLNSKSRHAAADRCSEWFGILPASSPVASVVGGCGPPASRLVSVGAARYVTCRRRRSGPNFAMDAS